MAAVPLLLFFHRLRLLLSLRLDRRLFLFFFLLLVFRRRIHRRLLFTSHRPTRSLCGLRPRRCVKLLALKALHNDTHTLWQNLPHPHVASSELCCWTIVILSFGMPMSNRYFIVWNADVQSLCLTILSFGFLRLRFGPSR